MKVENRFREIEVIAYIRHGKYYAKFRNPERQSERMIGRFKTKEDLFNFFHKWDGQQYYKIIKCF